MSKRRSQYITALDIGSSKIACFIASYSSKHPMHIIGIGHQISQGIKSGTITDIALAEQSIRNTVGAAEQMAGINVDQVIINVTGSQQKSTNLQGNMSILGREINKRNINSFINKTTQGFSEHNRDIIHAIPIEYTIDDHPHIKNPLGMVGEKLEVDLNIVSASSTSLANITNCLAGCHLDVDYDIAAPYASAVSCLTPDEKLLGSIILDMGGGSISIAAMKEHKLIYVDTVPLGGQHITNDLALGLSTNIENAERVKTLHGSLISTSNDDQELIDIRKKSDDGTHESGHVPRSLLMEIIHPRVEEMLELVKQKLDHSGISYQTNHIVITGGASQLEGMKEYCQHVFGKHTRIGVPTIIDGMAESTKGTSFATSAGMLLYAKDKIDQLEHQPDFEIGMLSSPMNKLVHWFKNNF